MFYIFLKDTISKYSILTSHLSNMLSQKAITASHLKSFFSFFHIYLITIYKAHNIPYKPDSH